jgi:hypothetical protein
MDIQGIWIVRMRDNDITAQLEQVRVQQLKRGEVCI